MNKKLMVGIVFLVLTSFVFAGNIRYEYTVDQAELDSYLNVANIDTSGSFVSWRCDFNTVPSVVRIGECYCVDTKGGLVGLENLNTADGFGYGNIYECLSQTNRATVQTSVQGIQTLDLNLQIRSEESVTKPTNVVINSVTDQGGSVECLHEGSASLILYTFYREKPFTLMQRGLEDTFQLPSYLKTGDSIKCQVSFYNGWVMSASEVSSNNLIMDDTSVTITSTYLAPAYPKANEDLYCYGNSLYDVNDSIYDVNHTFEFYRNGFLNSTTSYLDTDGLSGPYDAKTSGFIKGDSIYCNYTINVVNQSSGLVVNSATWITDPITIANSKPSIQNILITIKEAIFG